MAAVKLYELLFWDTLFYEIVAVRVKLLTAKPKHMLGQALLLLKNRFFALILPTLNRSG